MKLGSRRGSPLETCPASRKLFGPWWVSFVGVALLACNYRHSAVVEASPLPPPPGDRILHSSPLWVEVTETHDSQCVAYEGYRTLCFHGVRSALEKAVIQGLWPAFPDIRSGSSLAARPGDYVLQVEARLEPLPPDATGPGWSAGLQGRWRLLRDGQVLAEEALASRSRAAFPYGGALGEGGSEVIDALGAYLAMAVARVEEDRPIEPRPLPAVVTRALTPTATSPDPSSTPAPSDVEKGQSSPKTDQPLGSAAPRQAKGR